MGSLVAVTVPTAGVAEAVAVAEEWRAVASWRPHVAPGAVVALDDADFDGVAVAMHPLEGAGVLEPVGPVGKIATLACPA